MDYYLNYYKMLNKYKLRQDVQLYFDNYNHNFSSNKQYLEFDDNYFSELIKFIQKDNLNSIKEEIDMSIYENNEILKTLSTDIQNSEENNSEIEHPNLTNKTAEEKIELLIKELAKVKNDCKNDLLIEKLLLILKKKEVNI